MQDYQIAIIITILCAAHAVPAIAKYIVEKIGGN
jgi:hypothetical protein